MIGFIRQAEGGMAVAELGRQQGSSPVTKYGDMEAEDAKRPKARERDQAT